MDLEVCSNCEKILDDNDKIVRDGSGEVSHMYSQECVRWLRNYIGILAERLDGLESEIAIKTLPKE